MSSSIQMKEGMGEATINEQQQGMIIKVVGAVAVAHLLNDLIQAVLPAIYPMLKTNFSLSFAQVGLISLVYQITASLLQPWIGLYTDKHPKPYLLPLGMVVTFSGILLLAFSPNFIVLLMASALIGVPFATWLGQLYGWRAGFEFSASIAFLTVVAICFGLPKMQLDHTASIQNELRGLKNTQMWLTLAVGAIGFGGLFSVYSYVSPILTEYTHASIQVIPFALACIGLGLVVGGVVAGHFADKNLNKAIIWVLVSNACSYVLCALSMDHLATAFIALFLVSFSIAGLGPLLQTRLMDVAGNAQGLAASLNHSAFNIANAFGAFLGGWLISQGFGWLAPIWVGVLLSLGGLMILLLAFQHEKKSISACKSDANQTC